MKKNKVVITAPNQNDEYQLQRDLNVSGLFKKNTLVRCGSEAYKSIIKRCSNMYSHLIQSESDSFTIFIKKYDTDDKSWNYNGTTIRIIKETYEKDLSFPVKDVSVMLIDQDINQYSLIFCNEDYIGEYVRQRGCEHIWIEARLLLR